MDGPLRGEAPIQTQGVAGLETGRRSGAEEAGRSVRDQREVGWGNPRAAWRAERQDFRERQNITF